MKRILFLVLILAGTAGSALTLRTWNGGSTDMNAAANWTGGAGALSATDSIVFDATSAVNATASAAVSVGNMKTAGYLGAISFSGKTLTTVNGFNLTHAGTTNLGNGITMSENGALVFGSGIGAVTGNFITITFNGIDTLKNNSGYAGVAKLSVGNSGSLVYNKENASLYIPGTPWLVLGTNSKFSLENNMTITLKYTASCQTMSLGSEYTFNIASGSTFAIRSSTGKVIDTIPAMTITGGGIFSVYDANTSEGKQTWVFSGSIIKPIGVITLYNSGISKSIHKLNNITTSKLSIGQSGTTSFDTFVFYGYTYDLDMMDLSTYNPASGASPVDSLQSSIINCHTWIGGTNHSIIPGTSVVTIDSTGTVTSAGKSFYRFHVSAAGAVAINRTVTLADAFSCLDTLGILAGLFNDGGFAITCDNYINIGTTDSANISGTKNITRDFIRGVGSLAKNINAITRFVGAQNSQITLNQNKMERVRIVKTTSANGAVFLDTPDTLRSLRDSVGWCNDIAGVIVDSTNYFNDTVNIATLKCYDTLNFLTACKGTVNTVSFLGGTAGRCDDSGHQFTTTTVAKTATIPMDFYGLTKLGATTLTTGKVFFNDTVYHTSYTQNTADSVKVYKTNLISGNAVFNGGYYIPSYRTTVGGNITVTAGYNSFKRVSCNNLTVSSTDSTIFGSGDTTFYTGNLIFAPGAKIKTTGHTFKHVTSRSLLIRFWNLILGFWFKIGGQIIDVT